MKVSVQRSQIHRFTVDIVDEKGNIAGTKQADEAIRNELENILEFEVDVE